MVFLLQADLQGREEGEIVREPRSIAQIVGEREREREREREVVGKKRGEGGR